MVLILGLAVVLLGQIVRHIEKWSVFDGLYWSMITATTVGYGDIRPLKKVSKTLSILIALLGLMFTGLIIAVTLRTAAIAIDKHADQSVIEKMKDDFS